MEDLTTAERLLERVHDGKPIRTVLTEAVNQSSTLPEAAALLGVSLPTLRSWLRKHGLRVTASRKRTLTAVDRVPA